MSFMHQVRRVGKRSRWPYLIFAVILGIGLVGSFAMWSVPQSTGSVGDGSSPAGSRQDEILTRIRQGEQVLKTSPENLPVLIDLGNAYFDGGLAAAGDERNRHWQKGINTYQKALELDPKNVNVRVDMAILALYLGQQSLAESNFKQAIQDDPNHINAHLNYGIFLENSGKLEEARAEWKQVLELKPDEATRQFAQSLLDKNQ